MLDAASLPAVLESLQACDPSESPLMAAPQYLETVFADHSQFSRANSRAATPMIVRALPCSFPDSPPLPRLSRLPEL